MFDATNNKAEYEALIAGLKIAEQMSVENLQANVDSRLVADQVNGGRGGGEGGLGGEGGGGKEGGVKVGGKKGGTYVAKETDMIRYLEKVKTLTSSFKAFSIKQVPRNENKKADALSKIASISFAHLSKQVLVEELKEKSISAAEVLEIVEEKGDTWMNPTFKYLSDGTLPAEGKKVRAVKRSFHANYVLREIHEGSCNMHVGTRSVMAKALRIGYYLPTMHEDARKLIQACKDCQSWGRNKGYIGRKEQKLDGRTSSCPMGTPHNDKIQQRRHPFSLTYGTEAVIPVKIGMPTLRTVEINLEENKEALEINLDLLEERREQAAIREAKSKAKMERYYNSKVRSVSFKPGDLVYRNNEASRAEDTGKLGPKWEGPYEVTEALGKGAYKLRDRDGNQLPRTWNVSNLKKCYVHKM
ncbi:reverse transcriptase domain-containing protein [Tanacetum coccineum]